VAGGVLLLALSAQTFQLLVPFMILMAAGLLAAQDRVKGWIARHAAPVPPSGPGGQDGAGARRSTLPVGIAAVYGGYFGPGLSVIVLAVLGLFIDDNLTRLNALKQCISLAVNTAAAVFFLFTGLVIWPLALVMAAGALAGGAAGGTIAGRLDPSRLRQAIVAIGVIVGIVFLLRL
jgi:uncharacterized membrane protein YfcA